MKGKKLMAILFGTIAVTGISISTLANAAKSTNQTQKISHYNSNKIEMNTNYKDREQEAKYLAEIEKKFKEAGVKLTGQQEIQIRQAHKKMIDGYEQVFEKDTLKTLGKLILSAYLPEKQGSKVAESTGIYQPLVTFYTSVSNSLTPEQRPTWEKIWREMGTERQQESQANNFKITIGDNTVTVAERKQDFEKTKKKFRDAGLALTPQQETQMWEAGEKLAAELESFFQTNPEKTFMGLLAAALLPPEQGEEIVSTTVGKPLGSYVQSVASILTPQQREFWEKSFANPPKN